MKVRLLTGWNGSVKDTVLDLDEGTAALLIERAKAVAEPEPDAYPAVLQKAEKPTEDKAIKHAPANKSKPKRK